MKADICRRESDDVFWVDRPLANINLQVLWHHGKGLVNPSNPRCPLGQVL